MTLHDAAVRLITPTGQPTLTKADQTLLRHAEQAIKHLDQARGELLDAIALDNPVKCAIACRRLLGLGLLLGIHARDHEYKGTA